MSEWLVKFCKHVNDTKIVCDSKKVKQIYHYTSPEAARSILTNGKLRLTDRYYLNDYSEGKYAVQLCLDNIDTLVKNDEKFKKALKEELEKRKDFIQRDDFYVYQISFSRKKDSLCMWNYYTKGQGIQGYCFQFSFDNTKDVGSQILKPRFPSDNETSRIYAGKVIYNKKRQLKIVKKLVDYFLEFDRENRDSMVATHLVDKIIQQGIFFKKKCFSVEKEYRLAIIPRIDDKGNFCTIEDKRDFCVKNGMFVPHVDISFVADTLTEIMMSPTLEKEIVKQSIKMICADKYVKANVESSEIPVRY